MIGSRLSRIAPERTKNGFSRKKFFGGGWGVASKLRFQCGQWQLKGAENCRVRNTHQGLVPTLVC